LDIWKYFAVSHAQHEICNPLSSAKLDELIGLLELPDGGRVLDIACGKAEFLMRTTRRWSALGTGIDISPFFVADARARIDSAALAEQIEIVEANAAEYEGEPGAFDLVSCLGASWIWNGWRPTLEALSRWARPDGWVVAGEPFWIGEPSSEHLEASGHKRDSFADHAGNVRAGLDCGLRFCHAIASNTDDWDRYEGYQSLSVENYALANPDDPDLADIRRLVEHARDVYHRFGRLEFGWAAYVFRKTGA
jgi:SAM-dependent methyltransferase